MYRTYLNYNQPNTNQHKIEQMRKKYYKGDIVEVISHKYKSTEEYGRDPSYSRISNYGKYPVLYIGQRFLLQSHPFIENSIRFVQSPDERYTMWIHKDHVTLYKRPFINHIKAMFHV